MNVLGAGAFHRIAARPREKWPIRIARELYPLIRKRQIFGSWQLKVEFPSAPRPTMPEGQHRRGEIPLPPELQGILRGDD